MCDCGKDKTANGGIVARNKARLAPAVQPPGEQKEGYVLVKAILTRGAPDSVVPGVPRYPRMLKDQIWWIHPGDLAQTSYFEALPEEPIAPPAPEPEMAPESGNAPQDVSVLDSVAEETLQAAFAERVRKPNKPSRKEELKELLSKHE